MKQLFTAHTSLWSRRGPRITLVTALLAVVLAFSAFAFAPAAYAASATSQASSSRPNVCYPNQPCVTIWATHVNVRNGPPMSCFHHPAINCQIQGTIAGGGERVGASCQQPGQTVQYAGYTNNWWTLTFADNGHGGWISNVFIVGGKKISGVPDCNFT